MLNDSNKKIPHQFEGYFCSACKEQVSNDVVRCPTCNGTINGCSTYKGHTYYLQRKYFYELEIGDSMLLGYNSSYSGSHQILDITKIENGLYKVALKGDGVRKFKDYDIVSCVNGSYYGDKNPWE